MMLKNKKGDLVRVLVSAAALFLGMAAPVYADEIGSAPAFSAGQKVGFCYYSNVGGGTVTFSSARVYREGGLLVPEATDDCNSLPANRSCRVGFNITAATAHWCAATVNNTANLRGRFEIRNTAGVVLTSETMQ
jgi:hypothetical protein